VQLIVQRHGSRADTNEEETVMSGWGYGLE
jgi:hypothetical protein